MDKKIISEHRNFVIILLFTMALLVWFFGVNRGLWWDEAVYLGLSESLARGKGYYMNTGQETFRPPLFPAILSLLPFDYQVLYAIPFLFAILSLIAIYILAKRIYGNCIATWSILLMGTSAFFIFYSERIISESLFIFLSTLSLYFIHRPEREYTMLSGLLIGLSFLARYAGILLLIIYLVYPLIQKRKLTGYHILGVIIFLNVLAPWSWMNIHVYGSPIGAVITNMGSLTGEYSGGPP